MQYLVLADIHSQTITLQRILERTKIEDINACLIAGDLTNFGAEADLLEILEIIEAYVPEIYFCLGNCDPKIKNQSIFSNYNYVESKPIQLDNFTVIGYGGLKPRINYRMLNKLTRQNLPICLLSHVPPYETEADRVSLNRHVGSVEIKRTLEAYPIFLSLCGHVHDSSTITKHGSVIIVNPGPVTRGNYSVISINNDFSVKGKIFNINKGELQ